MKRGRHRIVSYRVAKLLKDVGFDWETYYRIYPDESVATSGHLEDYNAINEIEACSAPTHSDAIDWVLEEMDCFIEIDYMRINYNYGKKYKYFIINTNDEDTFGGELLYQSNESFETRNEAIEAALIELCEKTLKMIGKTYQTPKQKTEFDGIEIKTNTSKAEIIVD